MSTTTVSSAMISSGVIPSGTRNDIINGGLVVNQENQTAPADAAYTIGDLFLHNGEGTPVMSLETDGPQGTRPWQKMVLDANDQGGLAYIVPNETVQDYIANGKMSFGIQLKTTSATISNARIGVIKWTGTADAVTKELVGTWASDGTNPTLATSLSYENTPANLGLTTSWARHTVEDVTVDADTKNIILFVWTNDGTITASDVIGFSEWQLNPGSTVSAFSSPDKSIVQRQVDRHICRYDYSGGANGEHIALGMTHSATYCLAVIPWPVAMRATPVVTSSAAGTFKPSNIRTFAAVGTGISFVNAGANSCLVQVTTSSGFTIGEPAHLQQDQTDTTFIMADARIGV